MSRIKVQIAAGIFVLLTLVKLLVPGGAERLQSGKDRFLDRDTDYTKLLHSLQNVFDAQEETAPAAVAVAESAAEPQVPPYSPVTVSELRQELLPAVKVTASSELTEKVEAAFAEEGEGGAEAASGEEESAEPGKEELPEAVRTFLDSQAAFAGYELPANVSYELMELPFSYHAPVDGYSSSGFGYRLHPILNEVKFHYGTDVAANSGDTVRAFADGTVSFAGYSDSYGYYLTIEHSDGWRTLYAHCSSLLVEQGETVTAGEEVALVGATGMATGPHLHFELTHNGVYTNPEYYVNYV